MIAHHKKTYYTTYRWSAGISAESSVGFSLLIGKNRAKVYRHLKTWSKNMKFIFDILRGSVIGIANIIPGVSGGTLAVSMGIYDKIISSVTGLFRHFKKSFVTLLPYGIGMVVGLLGLSFIIEFLFANCPLPTVLLFIGLILGGVPALWNRIKGQRIGFSGILFFLLFFVLLILLPVIAGDERTDLVLKADVITIIKLFFIGIIASATMVIPGVSGSMILMSLGYYAPVLSSINNFVRAVLDFNISAALAELALLVPFGVGVLVGIFAIAKLIEFLLKRFKVITYCAVLGLVAASPISIFTAVKMPAPSVLLLVISPIALVAGIAAAYFLGKAGETETKTDELIES